MIIDKAIISDIPALKDLWREAFSDTDEFIDSFFLTAFDTERSRTVKEGNEIKAALYWFDCSYNDEKIAYIYAVATAKSHRGRGLCTVLMDDTHRHLSSLGYVGVLLVPGSEDLFRFYERLGYATCSFISKFSCSADKSAADIRKIGADEYRDLRKAFLPKGSVVQENENLEFLKTQASFYTGNGFLLAAKQVKDTLYGIELLGDTTAAPSIVMSLGCLKGQFRVPGNDIPFSMYHGLKNNNSLPPAYFGLAFD